MSGLIDDIALEIERSIDAFGFPDQVYPTSLLFYDRTCYFRYIKLKEYPHLHNFAITHDGILFRAKPLRIKKYDDGLYIDYGCRVPIMRDGKHGVEFFAIPNELISPYLPRQGQCIVEVIPILLATFFGYKITNPLFERFVLNRADDFKLKDLLFTDAVTIEMNGYNEFILPDC